MLLELFKADGDDLDISRRTALACGIELTDCQTSGQGPGLRNFRLARTVLVDVRDDRKNSLAKALVWIDEVGCLILYGSHVRHLGYWMSSIGMVFACRKHTSVQAVAVVSSSMRPVATLIHWHFS